MTPIQTNKPLFFDSEGNALEDGKIYIGQPATDPRTNPKTVTFRDSGGATFTAQQPLTTKAGRIVYNGLPIVALVDGEHSMLVLDSDNQRVEYSRSVNAPGGGESAQFEELMRVGLTLNDIKAFDVNVGDSVRSSGKSTATDGLGADWLVVSNTGSAGDDVDLIDFTNGLQGRRVTNKLYSKDYSIAPDVASGEFNPGAASSVWTGSATSVASTALSEYGQGFYVVEYNQATISGPYRTLLFVFPGSACSVSGKNFIDFGASEIHRWADVGVAGDSFFATVYEANYSANTRNIYNGTITQIWKV